MVVTCVDNSKTSCEKSENGICQECIHDAKRHAFSAEEKKGQNCTNSSTKGEVKVVVQPKTEPTKTEEKKVEPKKQTTTTTTTTTTKPTATKTTEA